MVHIMNSLAESDPMPVDGKIAYNIVQSSASSETIIFLYFNMDFKGIEISCEKK